MQVGFSKEGIVNGISVDIFSNSGIHPNDESTSVMASFIDNGVCSILYTNHNSVSIITILK